MSVHEREGSDDGPVHMISFTVGVEAVYMNAATFEIQAKVHAIATMEPIPIHTIPRSTPLDRDDERSLLLVDRELVDGQVLIRIMDVLDRL